MRRFAAAALLAIVALLLPGAARADPQITVAIYGSLGLNGWYVSNVTVNWAVTGAENSTGCDAKTLTADTAATTLTCTATSDGGATVVSKSKTFKIDKTAPSVAAAASRSPDANGWYNHALTVAFSGTDAMSGVAGCSSAGYSGPDDANASVSGSCADNAGNSAVGSLALRYDATGPNVAAIPGRGPDSNGWYNHPLAVSFSGNDATSGLSSCSDSHTYAGPDDAGASISGSCRDQAGNSTTRSFALKYDATAPRVAAIPGRSPDANGWYNHAVSVALSGSDAISGIAGCSPAGYSGPDSASAAVSGSCTDVAGNVGSASLPLKYDATPPAIGNVRATPGNRRINLVWTASPDTQAVQVSRTPGVGRAGTTTVYSGSGSSHLDKGLKAGASYKYTVIGFDGAGNSASRAITVTATGALFSPAPGARVASRPLLRWAPVRHATYYNVQLIRGRKIFSAWPASAHFRLPRSWVFQGQRYRLHRGVYRWYVWPGFGRFSAGNYGRLIGGSSFFYSG